MNIPLQPHIRQRLSQPVTIAYISLFVIMVIWALVPVFLKMLLAVLTPIELSFSRFLFSGGVLLIWVLLRNGRAIVVMFRQDAKLVLLSAIIGPLAAMVCFNFGILHVTIGTACVFAALEPFYTYLLAVVIGQETWQPRRMMSILVSLVGMVVVVLSRDSWGVTYWVSLMLITLSPMIWAANSIITKELVKRHSPLAMTGLSFVLSSIFLVPVLTPHYVEALMGMGSILWMALGYCVVSNILGFSVWYWSLKYLPPSSVAITMYLIPVLSVAAGVVFLHEPLSVMKAFGIATVLAGLYLVNIRARL